MHTAVETASSPSRAVIQNVLLGGFFAGLADFIYPTVKTLMAGNPWTQPWKGVASGLLGKAAREGGMEMVVLGASLHWFICISAAAILYFIVSRVKFLPRQWYLLAIIHGIAVLLVMNYVILPLSRSVAESIRWRSCTSMPSGTSCWSVSRQASSCRARSRRLAQATDTGGVSTLGGAHIDVECRTGYI